MSSQTIAQQINTLNSKPTILITILTRRHTNSIIGVTSQCKISLISNISPCNISSLTAEAIFICRLRQSPDGSISLTWGCGMY